MTPLDTQHLESLLAKCFDQAGTRDGWKYAHAGTAIRCTPRNSEVSGCSTSRQSSIASRVRFINVSSDLACVWHPRNSGTDAISHPSASLSITTLNSFFITQVFYLQ